MKFLWFQFYLAEKVLNTVFEFVQYLLPRVCCHAKKIFLLNHSVKLFASENLSAYLTGDVLHQFSIHIKLLILPIFICVDLSHYTETSLQTTTKQPI